MFFIEKPHFALHPARPRRIKMLLAGLLFACIGVSAPALADRQEQECTAPSSSLYGSPGLISTPNARMDPPGTVRAGISTLDPYLHAYAGFQIAKPLYVSLRQSASVSNLGGDPDRLYPGVDVKLRLHKESAAIPEIAIGMMSAIGHKRMAGEYLVFSKSYKNLDLSGGIGWGRLGSAKNIKNPLGFLANHFGKARTLDGEIPNEARDWFTGKDAGLFAGLEYKTPISGLSLKAEWGADRFTAEKALAIIKRLSRGRSV